MPLHPGCTGVSAVADRVGGAGPHSTLEASEHLNVPFCAFYPLSKSGCKSYCPAPPTNERALSTQTQVT